MPDSGIDRRTFERFRTLLRESVGISLAHNKEMLLTARVGKRMRALDMHDHSEYLEHVLADPTGFEMTCLVDAVSTNVTSFFREREHFDVLARLFKQWQTEGTRSFRFWSAACSTGEEPYTISMVLQENLMSAGLDIRILATDISTKVLASAKQGAFTPERVKQVPSWLVDKYFHRTKDGMYVVDDVLRNRVTFARLNLSTPPYPMSGPFDLIMCRNVMIYFEADLRKRILAEAERLLRPDGVLILGHAESLTGLETNLKPIGPSVYKRL